MATTTDIEDCNPPMTTDDDPNRCSKSTGKYVMIPPYSSTKARNPAKAPAIVSPDEAIVATRRPYSRSATGSPVLGSTSSKRAQTAIGTANTKSRNGAYQP